MEEFWIQHRLSEEAFQIRHHYEHRYQVIFVLQGVVRYQVEKKEYIISKGGMIVLNTLEEHGLEVLEYPYERYIFQIDPAFFQQEIRYPEIISIFVRRSAAFSHLLKLPATVWEEAYQCIVAMEKEYRTKDQYWKMMVGAGLRQLMVAVFRECQDSIYTGKIDASANLAFKIQNYLDHHYLHELTIDEIADKFFLNKHYISHLFKDVTGYSIMKYVTSLRMNKAKAMLLETNESISSIAVQCGYSNFTYFTKQFKKYEGCTPSSYRKTKR